MKHHVCRVPPPGAGVASVGKSPDRWQCTECRWVWRLNPVVLRWFRDVPAP
jgi:hypothetical protein